MTDDPTIDKNKSKKLTNISCHRGIKGHFIKSGYHSDFFTPPPTPNLLNPNIPAPMVQEFELRDLQFEAGLINDNYREFILPLLQNCSLFIGD